MDNIISVSDIVGYLYCPRKLYLKKVLKIREPFTKPMFLGKMKHDALDLLNKNEQIFIENIKEKINKQKIEELYKETLKKITLELLKKNIYTAKKFDTTFYNFYPSLLQQASQDIKLRTNACFDTIEKGFLASDLWKNLSPRYLTEYSLISPELKLKGRIDRIEFSPQEEIIIPYELKTRSDIYESDKIQLTAYAMLLENKFNKKIPKGIIEVSNSKQEILITEQLKNKVKKLVTEIINLNKIPKISANFKKCQKCSLSKECVEAED